MTMVFIAVCMTGFALGSCLIKAGRKYQLRGFAL